MHNVEIAITEYDGSRYTAEKIANLHLAIRQKQIEDYEHEFKNGIETSQNELIDLQASYIEPGGNFFIARNTNTDEIAGFCGLLVNHESKSTLNLKRLAVVPEYRGKQLGKHIVARAITWAKACDFKKIKLTTGVRERAKDLVYCPLGFEIVGHDTYHDDHLMELLLEH